MSRPVRVLFLSWVMVVVAAGAPACGTEHITVAKTSLQYSGAVLFSQRCSGCHTLSNAGTHGSAANVRTAQVNNGPNFNTRCERPITRVLYAIENGGFSGAYMPQNIVLGQDAINVAKFVSTYAGHAEPHLTGIPPCSSKPVGTVPPASSSATATSSARATASASATATTAAVAAAPSAKNATKRRSARTKKKPARS